MNISVKKEVVKKEVVKKEAADDTAAKRPSLCNERSRSQVLFRIGKKGPGETTKLKYSSKAEEARMLKKAKTMVDAECRKRGLKVL